MKTYHTILQLLIIFFLILQGCSTTYHVKDFPSEEKFYQNLRSSVKDKDIKIYTKEDSVFCLNNEEVKINDSLLIFVDNQPFEYSLGTEEIVNIKYESKGQGFILGLNAGTISGAVIGGLTHIIPAYVNRPSFSPPYQMREYNTLYSFVIGTTSGAIIGSIIGWLIGYDYIYQF